MHLPPRSTRAVLLAVVVLAGCSGASLVDTADVTERGGTGTATPAGATPANGTLEVHFINVGQSVSTLVVAPSGETMLIDTGHYNDDGEYVLQYLRAHGIERIDHLVATHGDADHIGGSAAIIEYYETEANGIGAVYDPGIAASTQTYAEYLDAVEEHGVTLYETREGDRFDFAGVDVQVLGPPDPYIEDRARNENSIVLRLSYGQTSFLLTGDAEDDQEAYLVSEYGQRLNATVLKAGHHGSASSTSGQLLDAVGPEAVVVSSAYDSQHGHPNEEVLRRLAERSIPTYWTATHGNVVFGSDGEEVSVRTQRAAPTGPRSLRDAEPIEPGTAGEVTERARISDDTVQTSETAVATDGGTGTDPDDGTSSADALVIEKINADAAGDDRENLEDEYVVFRNSGDETLDLSGWTVEDEVGATYTFPEGTTLAPGERGTLHTGSGTDTATDLYWGSGSPVWNNGGDTVIVRNSQGDVVRQETYG
jgi:competence protein ComEC